MNRTRSFGRTDQKQPQASDRSTRTKRKRTDRQQNKRPTTFNEQPARPTVPWNGSASQGLREAHVRDGVALTAFLSWLERAMDAGEGGGGGGIGWPLTEFTVAQKLDRFR